MNFVSFAEMFFGKAAWKFVKDADNIFGDYLCVKKKYVNFAHIYKVCAIEW